MTDHFDIYTNRVTGDTFTDLCSCSVGHDHPDWACQGGHDLERESGNGKACASGDCDATVEEGPLYRVNPKGEAGIFMCRQHSEFVNAWEHRLG